jgi:AcrR family transcriptional regulator
MSRTKESSPATRLRILDATLALLQENPAGAAVRMADIARRTGVSRQAVYLHFAGRAELLTEATKRLDALKDVPARLAASRAAVDGETRLDAFIAAWIGYLPEIEGVARALLAMRERDAEAAAAWDARMQDMREGCAAAIRALGRDGRLHADWTEEQATDLLWTLLSFQNWSQLRGACGWSQETCIAHLQAAARRLFVADHEGSARSPGPYPRG